MCNPFVRTKRVLIEIQLKVCLYHFAPSFFLFLAHTILLFGTQKETFWVNAI